MPIYAQSQAVQTITDTINNAISNGAVGIAVLLGASLIMIGAGMFILIQRVLVPLLKQVIQLTSQITVLVERTNEAIEHSNETNRLVTVATNEQTGMVQRMDKTIADMSGKFDVLSLNFGAYQTLQSDTVAALQQKIDELSTEIQKSLQQMLDQIATTNRFVEQAVRDHQLIISRFDEMKVVEAKVDQVLTILKAPTPPPVNPDNVTPLDEKPDSSGEVAAA